MALLHSTQTPIGWQAPDFDLVGTDDQTYNLDHFLEHQGLLISFTCNHCPYAVASWPELVKLNQKYGSNLAFVAINPNDATVYSEDSFENMKKLKAKLNIEFPYLYDETQATARSYDAQCTPDNYLFKKTDHHFELYFRGRINDNWQNPKQATQHNLQEAIESLLHDNPPPDNQPPSMGCSIKWQ